MKQVILLLALTMLSLAANACDVTHSPMSKLTLHAVAQQHGGKKICLSEGVYELGATTLSLLPGTTLEGLANDRNQVRLNSAATRAIAVSNGVMLKNFLLNGPGQNGEFGILSYYNSGVIIWGLRIQNTLISIGVNGSSDVNIWDTFMQDNGNLGNGLADPNVWITDASNVTILYGEARGRANGPGGDGEIAAYNSNAVRIDGTHVIDSGASAIYLVNCDNCSVANTTIHRPGEWGIDVVSGSDNFQASNNYVAWANFGGSVFDEAGSVGGTFTGNGFYSNRRMGVGTCNGINVIGAVNGVSQSGNWANPSGVICRYR